MEVEKLKPIALFDMDGSLCDYDGALIRDLKKLQSPNEEDIVDLRLMEKQPHLKERMDLIKKQVGWWENLEPLDLGLRIYRILGDLGFRIHILTQGPTKTTSAWTEKIKWCNKYLNTTDITITRDKGLVYGKILVDDFPDYAFAWLKYRPRGFVIMPKNSQNKDIEHPNIFICDKYNIDQIRYRCSNIADKFFSEKNSD